MTPPSPPFPPAGRDRAGLGPHGALRGGRHATRARRSERGGQEAVLRARELHARRQSRRGRGAWREMEMEMEMGMEMGMEMEMRDAPT